MTAPKHTPGPWVVDDDLDVCADGGERLIAIVDRRYVALRAGEDEANARLIAAAPDLLAVLERIVKYAREDRATTPGVTRLARALAEAERAIASAVGGCERCGGRWAGRGPDDLHTCATPDDDEGGGRGC